MNAEFLTPAPIAPLNLTLDVVELRSSADGANLDSQQQAEGDCYCCCCCCCGVEAQADTTAAA